MLNSKPYAVKIDEKVQKFSELKEISFSEKFYGLKIVLLQNGKIYISIRCLQTKSVELNLPEVGVASLEA